jgi:superfamily II DNA or RNA helicase
MSFIYITRNKDWDFERKHKFGFTEDYDWRLKNSHEQHSHLTEYCALYSIVATKDYKIGYRQYDKILSVIARDERKIKIIEEIHCCHLPLLRQFSRYLVDDGGSTEFFRTDGVDALKAVIEVEFPYIGLEVCKEYVPHELTAINAGNSAYIQNLQKQHASNLFSSLLKAHQEKRLQWNMRPYQEEIIKHSVNKLSSESKIYIELATGGGKSYVVYNLFKNTSTDTIIVFTPRKQISVQNIQAKYISILNAKYEIFDCSTSKSSLEDFMKGPNKKLIVACIQSHEKVHECIMKNNTKNISVWFDEAHWAVEDWCNKLSDDHIKRFWLTSTNHIDKRIYTSASPNKELVKRNFDIFGELYSPIKVKELMDLGWLCNIKPYVYCIKKDNVDILQYVLSSFQSLERNYGFSFHNEQQSAFKLFKAHYDLYVGNATDIKPYLLVGDDFRDRTLQDVDLEYNFRSIASYEENANSIGYVVDRYSMGYDFHKIDFVCFTDPKMSHQDIIQCIGRGTRPDGLGEDGKNIMKMLTVLLPVFLENEKESRYDTIKEVLKYVIHDIEYPFKDIVFHGENVKKPCKATENNKKDYAGDQQVRAALFDLLKSELKVQWRSLKELVAYLKQKSIHSLMDYNAFNKEHLELGLPEYPHTDFPNLKWIDTYIVNPYYSKDECIQKIKAIHDSFALSGDTTLDDFDDEQEKLRYLHEVDKKIPNISLWKFYGGDRQDYPI